MTMFPVLFAIHALPADRAVGRDAPGLRAENCSPRQIYLGHDTLITFCDRQRELIKTVATLLHSPGFLSTIPPVAL